MPTAESQVLREAIILALAEQLERQGLLSISADHVPGWPKPPELRLRGQARGAVPDLHIQDEQRVWIFEVETEDALEDPETAEQLAHFAAVARRRKGHLFRVVVPDGAAEACRAKLADWGLGVTVLEIEVSMVDGRPSPRPVRNLLSIGRRAKSHGNA